MGKDIGATWCDSDRSWPWPDHPKGAWLGNCWGRRLARGIASWLARRLTMATLRDLAREFGLTHPEKTPFPAGTAGYRDGWPFGVDISAAKPDTRPNLVAVPELISCARIEEHLVGSISAETVMASTTVESRLAHLETQLSRLQAELDELRSRSDKDWRCAVAKYAGDEDLQDLFAEAQHLREADRQRAHEPSGEAGGNNG